MSDNTKKPIKGGEFIIRDTAPSEIFIPEKVKDTIKNININLKGKIKYHLTSHWLNFFFSLQNVKLIQPSYSKGSFFNSYICLLKSITI